MLCMPNRPRAQERLSRDREGARGWPGLDRKEAPVNRR